MHSTLLCFYSRTTKDLRKFASSSHITWLLYYCFHKILPEKLWIQLWIKQILNYLYQRLSNKSINPIFKQNSFPTKKQNPANKSKFGFWWNSIATNIQNATLPKIKCIKWISFLNITLTISNEASLSHCRKNYSMATFFPLNYNLKKIMKIVHHIRRVS